MKDHSRQELESSRPERSAQECVDYCLEQLYRDRSKTIADTCAGEMTFEELIGALLAAKDELARLTALDEWSTHGFHTTAEKAEAFEHQLHALVRSVKAEPSDTIVEVRWESREKAGVEA